MRPKVFEPRSCPICCVVWTPTTRRTSSRKTCGKPKCAKTLGKGRPLRADRPRPLCQNCGAEFTPHKSRPFEVQKFCTRRCSSIYSVRDPETKRERGEFLRSVQPIRDEAWRQRLSERMTGAKSPLWIGGRIVRNDGYVHINRTLVPDWLRSMISDRLYIREHRLLMAMRIGRPLSATEVVHHRDGDKANNAIDNLELWPTNGTHMSHEHGNLPVGACCEVGRVDQQTKEPRIG